MNSELKTVAEFVEYFYSEYPDPEYKLIFTGHPGEEGCHVDINNIRIDNENKTITIWL